MDNSKSEIERLGLAMSLSARSQPGLIGSAIAAWETAHPDRAALDLLKCNEGQLWRIAVTPRPRDDQLVARAMELAADLGVNPTGLVNILRFAQTAAAFGEAVADGEMLMAALDSDDDDGDNS
jgi:hypothetical protein